MATKQDSEIKRVGRFGVVGIANTLIDFVLFNLLRLVMASPIASIISGTVAMINSYVLNQRFTFKQRHVSGRRTALFFAITLFGLYVIRPLVVNFFTNIWLWPAQTAYTISSALHLPFGQDFVRDNLALVAAIVIVLFYNYVCYKKWVFSQ